MSVAIVLGAGSGLGAALCHRFAQGGLKVAAARRDGAAASALAAEVSGRGYACDVAAADQVAALFDAVVADLGVPELVVFNAGAFRRGEVSELDAATFEQCWRTSCLGGFHVARAAVAAMRPQGRGTLIFTGATASLRGGAGFSALAVPKFGLRALAQSLARELGPEGLHVAHTLLDGQIRNPARGPDKGSDSRGPDALLNPEAIAEAYWQLHCQPRSAWTQELDLRPWVERF